jgi:hypothetical protein
VARLTANNYFLSAVVNLATLLVGALGMCLCSMHTTQHQHVMVLHLTAHFTACLLLLLI